MRRSIKLSRPRGSFGLVDSVALLLWCLGSLWSAQTILTVAARIVGGLAPFQ
jgi:hypothetical protein